MSLNRLARFVVGTLAAAILLSLILPFFGIGKAKFLPPPRVYATAEKITRGVVTGRQNPPSGNPFKVGFHNYFLLYRFSASAPPARGSLSPGPAQTYTGSVRVSQNVYNGVKDGQRVRVRYEKAYPDINGIDAPWGGRSVGPGSAFLSGWLLWVGLALIMGYGVMLIIEHFTAKENI